MKKTLIFMLAGMVWYGQGCSCETWTSLGGGDPEKECASHWQWKQKEAVVPIKEIVKNPCAAPSMAKAVQSYPTGNVVSLEKMAPTQVVVNQPFDYRIKVTNLTKRSLQNVTVKDCVPENVVINSSMPKADKTVDGDIHWMLGDLEPEASRTITVNAVAKDKVEISSCAEVSYDAPICARIEVVEPKIQIVKTAPPEVLECDRIPLKYVVTNTGTGYACNLAIKDRLHPQLVTAEGQEGLLFTLESLAPGKSQEFGAMVDATNTGKFASGATATSRNSGEAESNVTETTVRKPVLAISESGPATTYIGRPLNYEIIVTNKGDGIARDTVVEAMVPEDVRFESATEGGSFSRSSPAKVVWNIGTLMPNESKKVTMTLYPDSAGELTTRASARAYCAEMVSDLAQTSVTGVSAILLEVIDIMDPVEIGQSSIYVIKVTNQGSKAGTNIAIDCMLEEGMQYVSSTGPTRATVEGNKISFVPLASLAPKAQATWQIRVQAVSSGDMRFKATMNSDQITRPVEETEATMFYE